MGSYTSQSSISEVYYTITASIILVLPLVTEQIASARMAFSFLLVNCIQVHCEKKSAHAKVQ